MKPLTKNLLVTVLIVAAFFLFSSIRGDVGTDIRFADAAIELTAPEKFTCSAAYVDIADLELVEWETPGTLRGGDENRRYVWGAWEHEVFGPCTLCVSKKIDNAILVTLVDGSKVLFNYESEQTTEGIYKMLPELIANSEK